MEATSVQQHHQAMLRDMDELQGSLLPVAEATVPYNETSTHDFSHAAVQAANEATPLLAFDRQSTAGEDKIGEALPIPNLSSGNDPDREKELLRRADRCGALDVEEERRIAQLEKARLYAIERATKEQIRLANQRAQELVELEERGELEPPEVVMARMAKEKILASGPPATTPEVCEGSYGKDYEIKNYDVNDYETREYHIGDYKSVYETK